MTREGAALSMPRQPRVAAPTLPQFFPTWELRREGQPYDGRDGLPGLESRRRENLGETLALATSRPRLCSPRVPLVQVRHSKVDRRRDGDSRLVRSPAGVTLAVTLAVTSRLKKTTPW